MEPPSELQKRYFAALAERAALKRKLRALEGKYAALEARRAELERLAQAAAAGGHQPTEIEGEPQGEPLGKGQSDPGDGN
jgi:hypothetical protein